MLPFLSEFTRDVDSAHTIIVMDAEGMEQPRQYRVVPKHVLVAMGGAIVVVAAILLSLVVLTPLRELIPGYGTTQMREGARLNKVRLDALQDSLAAQQQYMNQLRHLLMGDVDSSYTDEAPATPAATGPSLTGELAEVEGESPPRNWTDHQQPALPVARMPVTGDARVRFASSEARLLPSIQLPTLPPVEGFFTRGFDARTGHFAVDIAVDEGTVVRSIGDGYVIFADWTYEGGYAIAVQHADGYVSVYKHNSRLLKRIGERVRAREPIATSGNTGESTTGPHVHFELWHDGLAQDPRYYFIGG